MNIQDEVQKIHHQYGTSEMANYKIQLLFDKLIEQAYDRNREAICKKCQREILIDILN